jgi:hypothetical protein
MSSWLIGVVRVKRIESPWTNLLLHCEIDGALWDVFFGRFGLSSVMPKRVVDLYACWWIAGSVWSATVWKMMPSCMLWCL